MEYILLAVSFAVILAGALFFTNAVEWAGHRLEMGEGATGSLLAAVGTAMPETLIPIVAIIGGAEGAEDVAVGAIIGAPFLLATIAMALVGISALIYRGRREQGTDLRADAETLDRDLLFFLVFFALGIVVGLGAPGGPAVAAGGPLRPRLRRLRAEDAARGRGGAGGGDDRPALHGPHPGGRPAHTDDRPAARGGPRGDRRRGAPVRRGAPPRARSNSASNRWCSPSCSRRWPPSCPEKANSFFWVREGKDSLALGNITGAMVFQSTIPIAVGLLLTDWELDRFAVVSGVLGLAGGVIAYWALRRRGKFEVLPVTAWILLFAGFIVYVAVS